MRAKDRTQYVEAWRRHVRELIHVMLDSDTKMAEWERIRDELDAIIEKAAAQNYPDEEAAA